MLVNFFHGLIIIYFCSLQVFLCLCEFMNRKSPSSRSIPSDKLPLQTRELRPAKNKESKEFQKTTEGVRKRTVDEKVCSEFHQAQLQ